MGDPQASDFQLLSHFLLLTIDRDIQVKSEKNISIEKSEASETVQAKKLYIRHKLFKLLLDFIDGRIPSKQVFCCG